MSAYRYLFSARELIEDPVETGEFYMVNLFYEMVDRHVFRYRTWQPVSLNSTFSLGLICTLSQSDSAGFEILPKCRESLLNENL